jgi:hypothetical protein
MHLPRDGDLPTAALRSHENVDRLTFSGPIIETGTTSYRLAHARQRRAAG